jgi:hypothetical protein
VNGDGGRETAGQITAVEIEHGSNCEIGECGMDTVVIERGGEAGLCFEELQMAGLITVVIVWLFGKHGGIEGWQ